MNDYELICLTLEEIRKQAYNLQNLKDTNVWRAHYNPDSEMKQMEEESIKECNEVLKATRIALRDDVLEDISNYNNGVDNICGVDVSLSEVSFDLIYERKTDKDYE